MHVQALRYLPETTLLIGINFIIASLVVLTVWLCWLFGAWHTRNNHWFDKRAEFITAAQCDHFMWGVADNSSGAVADDSTPLCLAAFLLWFSPVMLFGVLFFLGLLLVLISRTIVREETGEFAIHVRSTRYAIKLLGFVVG